jgi:hypothetical protein
MTPLDSGKKVGNLVEYPLPNPLHGTGIAVAAKTQSLPPPVCHALKKGACVGLVLLDMVSQSFKQTALRRGKALRPTSAEIYIFSFPCCWRGL